ncbi:response regulator [Actinokineospora enzanensis]|uniref:response regulator n=1 Tax=Actinokineospora enzanensis TaxID=155975 RepID=UPI000476FC3E|nr:response regulator transcription factor [Actinokineospora enzanensis]
MVRVVIADDQALLRASFRMLIESAEDLEVVGEAGDGVEAVEVVTRTGADVVLMDVRMPRLDGIGATRELRGKGARVLILTTFDLDEYVYGALRAGASGFLLKDTRPADLLSAIRLVARGEALLAPSVTRRLIGEFARMPGPGKRPTPLDGVTEREREVLVLIARGLSNAEIAERLVLSPATIKTHIGRLLAKLHARDRAQLVIAAYESGLITPSR